MTIRLEQLRRRADALADELADVRNEIDTVETLRFVQVNFHGHSKIYTYELAPGHEAKVGDYVCVYSPMTRRDELVKVTAMGRGNTLFGRPPKIAKEVDIRVRGAEPNRAAHSSSHPDEWDVFRGADIG